MLAPVTGWGAFLLLALVGGHMLWEGITNREQNQKPGDYTAAGYWSD
jgi:putative Mn2+ efflux pump MntP